MRDRYWAGITVAALVSFGLSQAGLSGLVAVALGVAAGIAKGG